MCFYRLIVSFYIGSILVLFGYSNTRTLNYVVQDRNVIILTNIVILWTFFSMGMTMYLIKQFLHINFSAKYENYLKKPVTNIFSSKDTHSYYLLISLLLVCIVSIVYVVRNTPQIPLFNLFNTSSRIVLAQLRIVAKYDYYGSSTIRNVFAMTLTPILSYIFYVYFRKYKTIKWIIPFLFAFVFSLFISIYDLQKGPVISYLFGFMFLNIIISGKINYKDIIKYILIVSLLVITLYKLVMHVNWELIPISIAKRIFISQLSPLYCHIKIFPDLVGYLDGQSLPGILTNILGIEHIRSGRVVMQIINPIAVSKGIAGVMCTLFIGEAYANFGWFSIIFAPIYIGLVVCTIYTILLKLPKNPLFVSINAYLCVLIPRMLLSGFTDFIFNYGFLCLIFIWGIFYFFGLISKSLSNNRFHI